MKEKEPLPEAKFASTFIMDFKPLKPWEIKFVVKATQSVAAKQAD